MKAGTKAAIQFCFGWFPGGVAMYRNLTRVRMGTQATHVEKLARVWPEYAGRWNVDSGARIHMLEPGWTPFPFFLAQATFGTGLIGTNVDARCGDRYLHAALVGLEQLHVDGGDGFAERKRRLLEALARGKSSKRAIELSQGLLFESVDPSCLPIDDSCIDVSHSGGVLEHYPIPRLRAFLAESIRILRPGGIASHVFDHRDHLWHADKTHPFLDHLRYSEAAYRVRFGHRLGFHNRLLPGEVCGLFESAGFERVAVLRRILPSHDSVDNDVDAMKGCLGIERDRLNERFAKATEADLRTAACHYLYRKPVTGSV